MHCNFLCFFSVAITATDTLTLDIQSYDDMQLACMRRLFALLDGKRSAKQLVAKNICRRKSATKPCDWFGVYCEEGKITKIDWSGRDDSYLASLKWVPSTVHILRVHYAYLNSALETRLLPACLMYCDLERCGLTGSLELRTLPPKLIDLMLPYNSIHGTLRLNNLPHSIEKIDIRNNPIKKVVVHNGNLPAKFYFARFFNHIGNLKIACVDARKADNRVHILANDEISLSGSYSDSPLYDSCYFDEIEYS